jgi:hypothetical protein
MRTAERITYAAFLLAGILMTYQGRQWGVVLDKIPGPGFMPFWTGILTIFAAFLALALSLRDKSDGGTQPFTKSDLYYFCVIIGSAVFVVIFAKLAGLLVSIGLMSVVCSRLMGMKNMWFSGAVAAGMVIAIYLVFVLLLEVPLPKNALGLI